VRAYSSGG